MILDKIENAHFYTTIHPGIANAFEFIKQTDFERLPFGKHEIVGEELFVIFKEYHTKPVEGNYLESHQAYIDVQYIVEGTEEMGVAINRGQVPHQAYNSDQDYALFETPYDIVTVKKGMFAIFFPDDMHLPDITTSESAKVKKAVFKVKIQHS